MDWTLAVTAISMLFAGIFLCAYVGLNWSLSSILLALLLLLHGPAYIYYIKVWGPASGYLDFVLTVSAGQPVIETVNIALAIMFAGVCFGIFLADFLAQNRPAKMEKAIDQWKPEAILFDSKDRQKIRLMILAVTVLMVPFLVFDNQIGNVIVYFGTLGGETEKIDLRRQYGGSSIYLYNLLTSNFVPFLAFCGLAAMKLGKWKGTLLLVTFVALIMLAKLAALSKGPFAILLIQFGVVIAMTRSIRLSAKKLLLILGLVIATFVGMVLLVNAGQEMEGLVFDILIYRSLMIPNESIVEYFSAIPYVLDFTWGGQISWLATLFQSEPKLPTYWLVGEVHRGSLGSTTTAMFLADAWADFSWFGVVGFPILAGACVRAIDIKLLTVGRPTVWKLGALAMGHFGLYVAMNTSFTTALLTGGLMFAVPFAVWLPRWTLKTGSRNKPLSNRATP